MRKDWRGTPRGMPPGMRGIAASSRPMSTEEIISGIDKRLQSDLAKAQTRIKELEAEVTRLQGVCRNIYEVWAGSEGIPKPETAVEAYLLSLIDQMRDEAKAGLK